MKTKLIKNQLTLAVACALALGFASTAAFAQRLMPNDRELWTAAPIQVWKNGFGECWHSAFGPPPGTGECNPAPLAQSVPPTPAAYVPPVAAAAAPLPVYDKVALEANVLFDFDKSTLRPAGRDTLDDFADRMKGVGSAAIAAVGFADRFGTDGYNQALSERRVATVTAYLASKGIEPKWEVHSSAKGESQPTTAAGDCEGSATPSTIACLQPDRHVSVEGSGTRIKP